MRATASVETTDGGETRMNRRRRTILWYLLPTVLFVVLLYFADVQELIAAMTAVRPAYFALAIVSGCVTFLVWGLVWQVLFSGLGIQSRLYNTIRIALSANFVNSVTPLGQFGGEPVVAYIIADNTNARYERGLSCVVSADLINASPIVTYMGTGLLYLFIAGALETVFVRFAYLYVGILVGGVVLAYVLWFKRDWLQSGLLGIIDWLTAHIGPLQQHGQRLKAGIKRTAQSFMMVGNNPLVLAAGLVLAHIAIGTQFGALYLILLAKGIEPTLPAVFFPVIVAGFAIWAPTPGGSGAYEATFAAVLLLFYSFSFDTALAVTILFRIATFWSGIVIGYVATLSLGTRPARS